MSKGKPEAGTLLNKSHPLANGLVSCLWFNEGGGRLVTDVATGLTATLNSNVFWAGGDNGVVLRNLTNIGASPWFTFPANPNFNLGNGPGTILVRVKNTTATTNQRIVCFGPNDAWELYTTTAGVMRAYNLGGERISTYTLPSGTWTTMGYAVTSGSVSGSINFFANGNPAGTTALGATVMTTNAGLVYNVGNLTVASACWIGDIDWIRIYRRALSLAEVQQLTIEPFADALPPGRLTKLVFSASARNVAPTGIASAGAFGTAVVGRGAVNLSPSGISSGSAFGTATVGRGAVTVSPTGIASAQAFGTATVRPGAVSVSPSGIASAASFGTAVVSPGAVQVAPTGITSGQALGSPTVAPGAVSVSPAGIASAEALGSPTVVPGAVQVAPSGISSAEGFGTATVGSVGTLFILPTGIPSGGAVGRPVIIGGTRIRGIPMNLPNNFRPGRPNNPTPGKPRKAPRGTPARRLVAEPLEATLTFKADD